LHKVPSKDLETWTSLLVMLFNSKKPACLGLQDLLQNANVVTVSKPKGSPHRKREFSGMSDDGVELDRMVVEVWYFCKARNDWAQVLHGLVMAEDAETF
jgi:hypothetical protein